MHFEESAQSVIDAAALRNKRAALTLTRPSNVLPYTAGDVIGSNGTTAPASATVTITNGADAVVTWGGGSPVAHNLASGDCVMFKTAGGTIGTGLTDDTQYFAALRTFQLAATLADAIAGTPILDTSGATGATCTCTATATKASATVTITNGADAVVTWGGGTPVSHLLRTGDAVTFATTPGVIGTGLVDGTTYYVIIPKTFYLAASKADALVGTGAVLIDTSGAGTGTTTASKIGSAILEIPAISLGGNTVRINQSNLLVNVAAVGSRTTYRLHLYESPPPSALLDNDVWTCPAADAPGYLGYIDLGTLGDIGDVCHVQTTGIGKDIAPLGTSLYGYLQTGAGFTPTSAETMTLRLYSQALQ